MHGLRCTGAMLGWTRLLDEWVTGLVRYNRIADDDPVCWQTSTSTFQTLADAATRVRSFAYRDEELEPTQVRSDHTMSVELQGVHYDIGLVHECPASGSEFMASAVDWLAIALKRAPRSIEPGHVRVGAVLITPKASKTTEFNPTTLEGYVAGTRKIETSGCAFSFPDAHDLDRYRYVNQEYPGAMLLVAAEDPGGKILA